MNTSIILLAIFSFVVSFPFGAWRAYSKQHKQFWNMMLAIHIPVIAIIAARFGFHLSFSVYSIVLNVISFSLAQYIGGKIWYTYTVTTK